MKTEFKKIKVLKCFLLKKKKKKYLEIKYHRNFIVYSNFDVGILCSFGAISVWKEYQKNMK